MSDERWLNVVGFEGCYIVSDRGRVMSLPRRANHISGTRVSYGKVLRPSTIHNGYNIVTLCKNGKRYSRLVHRLVAEAFIQNPDNLPQVNHKNFDRKCNNVENLEWCTGSENSSYSESAGRLLHNSKRIIRDDGIIFGSVAQAARELNIDPSTVSVALCKTKKDGSPCTAGGHTFRYV